MDQHPKPIEGHLAALGLNPSRLSDEEREQIAMVIIDAYVNGTGLLVRDRTTLDPVRFLWRKDPTRIRISIDSHHPRAPSPPEPGA